MPQQVNQNTIAGCMLINISGYLKNWSILVLFREENHNTDSVGYNKVTNFGNKWNNEGLLKCLKLTFST